MTREELAILKEEYNTLLERVEKAIAYYNNDEIPLLEKMDHWEAFIKLLHKIAGVSSKIVEEFPMTQEEWDNGFPTRRG